MPSVDSYAQSLRPSQHQGSTFTKTGGHPLDESGPLRVELTLPSSPALSRSPPLSRDRSSSRSSSRPLSAGGREQLKGPERFFYDKSSYTGVHAHGGPKVKDCDTHEHDLRSGLHSGSCVTKTSGHPLDCDKVRTRGLGPGTDGSKFEALLRPGHHEGSSFVRTAGNLLNDKEVRQTEPQICSPSRERPSSRCSSQTRPSTCSGPERFFYDKSTYTGVHARGGISNDVGSGFSHSLRPGHHTGSAFTHVKSSPPLSSDGPRHLDVLTKHTRTSTRRASVGSTRELKGPERFFYDKSSYTGVHKNGGPTTIDGRSAWANSMRPGMH